MKSGRKLKSRMKLWLAGLVVVLLLIVLAGPGGVGMMAEGQYRQVWQNALETEPGLEARVVDYDRGWFNSRSTVEIRVSDPMAAEMLSDWGLGELDEEGVAVLSLNERIHHGPVPFTAPAPLSQRWRPGFATVDSRPDENLPFIAEQGIDIRSTTHLGMLGGLRSQVRVKPFDGEIVPDTLRMSIDETITLDVRSNRRLDRINARFRSGEITLQDSDEGYGARMTGFWVNADQRRGPGDIWLGGSELRLASMDILTPAPGQATRMEGLLWASFVEEKDDGLIAQDHEIELQAMIMEGFEAGPLEMDWSFFNLHPESLNQIQKAVADAPELEGQTPADMDANMMAVLRDPILSLMEYRPGVRLSDLSLTLPGGELTGDGEAQVRDMGRNELAAYYDRNELFQITNAEAEFAADRNLVQRAIAFSMMGSLPDEEMEEDMVSLMDMQIDSAIQEGMLSEKDDGRLGMRVELRDGAVLINDREMFRF